MLNVAILVLGCAALLGLTLLATVLRGHHLPVRAGYAHGTLAATGVVLLAVAVLGRHRPLPVNTALLLFTFALVGGVFNLLFRLQDERPPGFMVGLHAGFALVALLLLGWGLLHY